MERLQHKETHRAYTLDFKLAVVDWLHSHSASYRAAARQFGIDRKMVRDWVERKEFLRRAVLHYGPKKKKLHHGRRPFSLDLDKAVLDYLVQERAEGRCVRDKQLTRKALEFSHCLGLDSKFKATSQWLKRWKRRVKVTYKDGSNHYDPDAELFEEEGILTNSTKEVVLSQCLTDCVAEAQDDMPTLNVLMDGEPNSLSEGINALQQSSLIDHNYCKTLNAQDEPYQVVDHNCCSRSVDMDNDRSLISDKLLQFDGTIFELSTITEQVLPDHQDLTS